MVEFIGSNPIGLLRFFSTQNIKMNEDHFDTVSQTFDSFNYENLNWISNPIAAIEWIYNPFYCSELPVLDPIPNYLSLFANTPIIYDQILIEAESSFKWIDLTFTPKGSLSKLILKKRVDKIKVEQIFPQFLILNFYRYLNDVYKN
jgi:hypothetical protein